MQSQQTSRKLNAETLAWQAAGLHCSANERRADEASRDVEIWLKCRFMKEHLGEEYGGMVSSATSFGLFVTLDDLYVEGLVHITELGGEYFHFDDARQELRGERTGKRFSIGSRVRVQVSRVDLDGRRIDFRLVHEGQPAIARSARDRSAVRDQVLPNHDVELDFYASNGVRKNKLAPRVGEAKKIKVSGKGVARGASGRGKLPKPRS